MAQVHVAAVIVHQAGALVSASICSFVPVKLVTQVNLGCTSSISNTMSYGMPACSSSFCVSICTFVLVKQVKHANCVPQPGAHSAAPACVQQPERIRKHTSAYVSIRQHTSAHVSTRQHTSAYVSIRQHTSAYVSIRQHLMHTSAYVSIRQYA